LALIYIMTVGLSLRRQLGWLSLQVEVETLPITKSTYRWQIMVRFWSFPLRLPSPRILRLEVDLYN